MKRLTNTIDMIKNLDKKTLEALKLACFFAIVVDLFGIYWYFGQKKLGMAILIVTIVVLAIILFLLQKYQPDIPTKSRKEVRTMPENKTPEEKPLDIFNQATEETKETEETPVANFSFDLGLPDADEYEKRMTEALHPNF